MPAPRRRGCCCRESVAIVAATPAAIGYLFKVLGVLQKPPLLQLSLARSAVNFGLLREREACSISEGCGRVRVRARQIHWV